LQFPPPISSKLKQTKSTMGTTINRLIEKLRCGVAKPHYFLPAHHIKFIKPSCAHGTWWWRENLNKNRPGTPPAKVRAPRDAIPIPFLYLSFIYYYIIIPWLGYLFFPDTNCPIFISPQGPTLPPSRRGPGQGTTWAPFPARRIPRPHRVRHRQRHEDAHPVRLVRNPSRTRVAPPPSALRVEPTSDRCALLPPTSGFKYLLGPDVSGSSRPAPEWGGMGLVPYHVGEATGGTGKRGRGPPRATRPIRSPRGGPTAHGSHAHHSFSFF